MKRLEREIVKEDGTKIGIYIRKPTNGELTRAEKVRVKNWSKFKSDPDIMSKVQLNRYLQERGIWDKVKEDEKRKLEKYIGELQDKLSRPIKRRSSCLRLEVSQLNCEKKE